MINEVIVIFISFFVVSFLIGSRISYGRNGGII